MRRLALLAAVLGVLLMVRGLWSGGAQWGTPTNPTRAAAKWQVSTDTSGPVMPEVAIAGELLTGQLQSASWSLGIPGFLADLGPNSASLSFVGQVAGVPGDTVVISTPLGVAWVGRVDTHNETRDINGDHWTTVTATDRVGALGAATLEDWSYTPTMNLEELGEDLAADAGIALDIVDGSLVGLNDFTEGPVTTSGSVLSIIAQAARASNAMLALRRDGKVVAVVRESVAPSSVLTLTGVNAPTTWAEHTSVDTVITKLRIWGTALGVPATFGYAADMIALYGERTFDGADFESNLATLHQWEDWEFYCSSEDALYPSGTPPRPIASGAMLVTSWTQTALILLDPMQWITESGTAWQVMSIKHDVSVGQAWTVAITADNLLDLLVDVP